MPASLTRNEIVASSYFEHIARRLIAHQDYTEIGEAIGVNRQVISRIVQMDEFKKVFNEVQKSIYAQIDEVIRDERQPMQRRIDQMAPKALTKLFDKMEHARSDRVQLDAAVHLLGIAGHSPIQRKVVDNLPTADLPQGQLDAIADAIASALSDNRVKVLQPAIEVVDVTPEDTTKDGDTATSTP